MNHRVANHVQERLAQAQQHGAVDLSALGAYHQRRLFPALPRRLTDHLRVLAKEWLQRHQPQLADPVFQVGADRCRLLIQGGQLAAEPINFMHRLRQHGGHGPTARGQLVPRCPSARSARMTDLQVELTKHALGLLSLVAQRPEAVGQRRLLQAGDHQLAGQRVQRVDALGPHAQVLALAGRARRLRGRLGAEVGVAPAKPWPELRYLIEEALQLRRLGGRGGADPVLQRVHRLLDVRGTGGGRRALERVQRPSYLQPQEVALRRVALYARLELALYPVQQVARFLDEALPNLIG